MAYTGASYDDPGAYFDQDVQNRANDPYSQYSKDPAQLAQQRALFIQSQTPENRAQLSAYGDQTRALQIARDASLGMMNPGSIGANGTDYGKAQADPSAALAKFDGSGYTGQQALSDGWLTGVGTPGWQSTPQAQRLNPSGGNMAAMAPGSPGWGVQAATGQQYGSPPAMQQGQTKGGPGNYGSSSGGGQGIYGQLGQQLAQQRPQAPRSPYGSFGGGAPQAGNPYASLISNLGQQAGGGQSPAPQMQPAPRPAPAPGGGVYGQLQAQLAQRR